MSRQKSSKTSSEYLSRPSTPVHWRHLYTRHLSKSAKVNVIHVPAGRSQRQTLSYPDEWLSDSASKSLTPPSLQNSSLVPRPPKNPPLSSFSRLGPSTSAHTSLLMHTSRGAFPLRVTLYLSACPLDSEPPTDNLCIYISVCLTPRT